MCPCKLNRTVSAVLAVWLASAANPQANAADPVTPVHWKQSVFSIPYQMDRSVTPENAPLEVRLMMSRDGGETWQQLQSAKPHVKGFIYNAPEDGEYWFAVQTVDRFGKAHPPADFEPELHVVVDTSPPKLDVVGQMNAAGEVELQYSASDPHLQPTSLSLTAGAPERGFQPLAAPEVPHDSAARLENRLTFAPPGGANTVQVRAEITDRAGNRSVTQIEVDPTRTGQPNMHRGSLAASQRDVQPGNGMTPKASSSFDLPGATAWAPVGEGGYPKTPFASTPAVQPNLLSPPDLATNSAGSVQERATQAWPVDQTALAPPQSAPLGRGPEATDTAHSAGNQAGRQHLSQAEVLPAPRKDAKAPWSAYQTSSALPAESDREGALRSPVSAPAGNQGLANRSKLAAAESRSSAPAAEEIPPGETINPYATSERSSSEYPDTGVPMIDVSRPREAAAVDHDGQSTPSSSAPWQLVNSRTVAIDYEVSSFGPWGVSEVELWGTRDGGQTWRRYAVDDDNRSPVMATVEGEGEYGFRVVVHSAGGFAAPQPKSGDAPEALVRVDLVRPDAVIETVEQGTGNRADQILIRWKAEDAQLARQPVTLYYSSQPAGPWSIIAAGLENTGNYAWRAERHLPDQLYVRLEVRDAAGNATTFQTSSPVTIRRPQPQARIREIRSYGASAQPDAGPLR